MRTSGRHAGRGGRGNISRGRGRGRGQNCTGTASSTKKGSCEALGLNIFDHGQKAAADQMRSSMEKITEHVGTMHGQDISNELQSEITVVIAEPVHAPAVLLRHGP